MVTNRIVSAVWIGGAWILLLALLKVGVEARSDALSYRLGEAWIEAERAAETARRARADALRTAGRVNPEPVRWAAGGTWDALARIRSGNPPTLVERDDLSDAGRRAGP